MARRTVRVDIDYSFSPGTSSRERATVLKSFTREANKAAMAAARSGRSTRGRAKVRRKF